MLKLKVLLTFLFFSASVCSAVQDGVYSCKPERFCQLRSVDLENFSLKDVPSQEQVEKALEQWKIPDEAEEFFVTGVYSKIFSDMLTCIVPTNLKFQDVFGVNPIIWMAEEEFSKRYPAKKLVLVGEEIKLLIDLKNKTNVEDEVGDDKKTVALTYRIVSREEDIVVADLYRPSHVESHNLSRYHGFVQFSGDRLVTTYMHARDAFDYDVFTGMNAYRCERI